MNGKLVVVGLGPGGLDTLTVGTYNRLKDAGRLFVRTGKHPAAEELAGQGIRFQTFDYLYEKAGEFREVYSEIAQILVDAARSEPVVYAVTGHPLVGESSVFKALELAEEAGIAVEVLPALSFVDSVISGLRLDISAGLKLIDGFSLIAEGRYDNRPEPGMHNLIMQVYNSLVASDVKLTLMEFYPDEHGIIVISAAGIPGLQRIMEIPLFELDRLEWIDHLTCVLVPPLGASGCHVSRYPLDRLADMMERLRDEDGCPWDREQTHQSLKRYMIEETYEVLEAIDEGNMYKVCEELGDLLLQVVFHAQIAREHGFFDMNDVIRSISDKLVRRHPHVFGDTVVNCSKDVSDNWEAIKRVELELKGEVRKSLLDGVPKSLPGLLRADKVQRKAAKAGFDWPDFTGALEKVLEESAEVRTAASEGSQARVADEVGDLLFAVVNLARLLKVDPEEALAGANRKFCLRYMEMERLAAERDVKMEKLDIEQLDKLWEEAKIFIEDKKKLVL